MSNYNLKLIDNTYSPEDAKEVLSSLISDKIKFLNLQIFSKSERFGEDTAHLENRVKYLEEERERLFKLIERATEDGKHLSIHCDIQVESIRTADMV